MSELVEFLRARLAEDERTAQAAGEKRGMSWVGKPLRGAGEIRGEVVSVSWPIARIPSVLAAADELDIAEHIAGHDPARVLQAVEAGRRVVAEYEAALQASEKWGNGDGTPTARQRRAEAFGRRNTMILMLRLLALTYSGHPDYREEWQPVTPIS